MKYYRISENNLKELLYQANRAYALDGGGVDNWMWAGESVCDFIETCSKECQQEFTCLGDIVEYELAHYSICRCDDAINSFDEMVEALP